MFVELPIQWSNGFYGNQAVRNPLSIAQIMPGMSGGTSYFSSQGLTGGGGSVNGAPPGAFKTLVDGQDSTKSMPPAFFFYQQPSVEALEEVSLQTGNYVGRVRPGSGRHLQLHGQVRHQPISRRRFLSSDQRGPERPPALYGIAGCEPAEQFRRSHSAAPCGFPMFITDTTKPSSSSPIEGFRSVLPVPNSGTFTTVPNAERHRVGNFSADIGGPVSVRRQLPAKTAWEIRFYAGQIFDPTNVASDGYTRFRFRTMRIPHQPHGSGGPEDSELSAEADRQQSPGQ